MLVFCPVIEEEVLELKAELDAEYKRQSETLDNFLEMLRRRRNGVSLLAAIQPSPSPNPVPKPQPKTDSNTPREKRVRGMLKAMRSILNDMPETFTSFQAKDALEVARPEFKGRIKLDSMRGVLNALIDEGWIKQIEVGVGPKPALYQRIKRVEGNM
jgi:hypothetical protein